jgi:xylulokinase
MPQAGPQAPFLIGIDIGTQSIRALLADARGRTIACAARPTPTIHLGSGQAEYDPEALWHTTLDALGELARAVPPGGEVAGIACASMGEACVLVDETGASLGHAITWFDRRTETQAASFERKIGGERLFAITGLPADPTLTLCKLLWHRERQPALFARARCALNLANWIAFRLCGEAASDESLASRTLCLDMATRAWSAEVLAVADLDPAMLPPLRPSGTPLGSVRAEVLAQTGLPGRPVVGVGGHDHVCGGFAAGAGRPGVLLDSLGTAEALFLTVARPVVTAENRHKGFWQGIIGLHRPFAYLGAGINSSGGTIEWFRTLLGDAEHPVPAHDALIAEAAALPPGSHGTGFLPHLAYGTPPYIDLASRGGFVGLTTGTTRGAMFRAVLEGLALEARLCVDAMAALPGAGVPAEIRVIGGGTRNPLFLRIKASVYGRPLTVIGEPEATALGAALLGGLAAGLWPDLDVALASIEQKAETVEPDAAWIDCYETFYDTVYRGLYPALAPLNHALTRFDSLCAA